MSRCHQCQRELTPAELESGVCPDCNAQLDEANANDSAPKPTGDDLGATVDSGVFDQLVERLNESGDIDRTRSDETVFDSRVFQSLAADSNRPESSGDRPADADDPSATKGDDFGTVVDSVVSKDRVSAEDVSDKSEASQPPKDSRRADETIFESRALEELLPQLQRESGESDPDDPPGDDLDKTIDSAVLDQLGAKLEDAKPPEDKESSADATVFESRTLEELLPEHGGEDESSESDDDLGATVDSSVFDQSLLDSRARESERVAAGETVFDSQALDLEGDSGDADDRGSAKTVDSSAGILISAGKTVKSIDDLDSSDSETIDSNAFSLADAADAGRDSREPSVSPSAKTVDSKPGVLSSADQTVDSKVVGLSGSDATIDSSVVPSSDPGNTVDSSHDLSSGAELTSDVIHHSWIGAIPKGVAPEMSLKASKGGVDDGKRKKTKRRSSRGRSKSRNRGPDGGDPSATSSSLVIQERALTDQVDMETPPDYGVLKVLGKGGMGVVYSAHQGSLDRDVAVKMLRPEGATNEKARDAFLSEACVTGELEHPNIVPIYDLGRTGDGAFFYAMKQVQGTPWNENIDELTLDQNIDYLLKVCDAIAFAHAKGIIHRDLKPENTMLGDFGEVLVMDWGLAIPTETSRTIAGIPLAQTMAGTPSYMAPEMAVGPFEKITTLSDIYLLGAILFEIVTGKRPHTGRDAMDCMLAAAKNQIQKTEHSGELLDIALKAMSTRPENRYQTVQDFQTAVRDYRSHSESIALTNIAIENLQSAGKSKSYDLFNQSVFGFQQAIELWEENETAREKLVQAKFDYAKAASERGDYDLGADLLDVSIPEHSEFRDQIVVARHERDQRQQRFQTYKRLGFSLAGLLFLVVCGAALWIYRERGKALEAKAIAETEREQAVVARQAEQEQREIAEQRRSEAEQAREDEKQQRLIADEQRELAVKRQSEAETARENEKQQRLIADEQRELAVKRQAEAETARENEKQQRLLADEQRELAVQRRAEAEAAREAEAYEGYVARIAAAAAKIDENAYLGAQKLLAECIPAEGETDYRNWEWGRMWYLCQQASSILETNSALEAVAATDDNGRLGLIATGGQGGILTIWDRASDSKRRINVDASTIHSLDFAPSQTQLAVGTDDPNGFIKLVDLDSGDVSMLASSDPQENHTDAVLSVQYSDDGDRLLSGSRSGKVKVWRLDDRRAPVTLHRHRWWVWQAKFFPSDERGLQTKIISVSQDGSAIVWQDPSGQWNDASAVEQLPPFRGHRGPVYAVAVAGDGATIATSGLDSRILIWNANDLRPFDYAAVLEQGRSDQEATPYRELIGHTAMVRSLDFAETGMLLVSAGHDNTVRVWNAEDGSSIKTLRGHGRWVRQSVVSPDGRRVVSAGFDQTARLWDIEGYEEMRVLRGKVLQGHEDAILAAEFSSQSDQVVTASRDRTIKSWEFATGRQLRSFREGHAFLASDAVSFANGTRLATAAVDDTVRIWDVESGGQILELTGTGRGAVVAASRDGRLLLTGGPKQQDADGNVVWLARLWDAATGEQLREMAGHKGMVCAVAISPDASVLYTGDVNGTGFVWSTDDSEPPRRLAWHQTRVLAAGFSPDGNRLVTASSDRGIAQWDVAEGTVQSDRTLLHPVELVAVDIDASASRVVTLDQDNLIRIWDADSREVLRELSIGEDSAKIDRIAISPDHESLLVVDQQNRAVRVFETESGQERRFPQTDQREGALVELPEGAQLSWATFTDDNRHVISVGGDQVRLWELNDQQSQFRRLRMTFSPHGSVASASFSNDASEIVSGSWDGTANIWDSATGRVRQKLVGKHSGAVRCAAFSKDPNSRFVATVGTDKTIVLWNAESGEFIRRYVGHDAPINWVEFSPDGQRMVTAAEDNTVKIWQIDGDREPMTIRHEAPVLRASFAPDGKRIASGTQDNVAYVWDADSAELLLTLEGHTAPVTSVAFTPDGNRVITGSQDFTAKLWDVTDRGLVSGAGKELLTLTAHERAITSVSFSPSRLHALTSSEDGTAIIWMAAPWTQDEQAGDGLAFESGVDSQSTATR